MLEIFLKKRKEIDKKNKRGTRFFLNVECRGDLKSTRRRCSACRGGWIGQLVLLLALLMVVVSDLVSDFTLFFFFSIICHFFLFQYGCDPSQIYYAPPNSNLKQEKNNMRRMGMTVLLLGDGEYTCSGDYFLLDEPTKISGQGCGKTTLVGFGLKIKGNKSDGIVEIEDLKIKGVDRYGLFAYEGMNVIMRGCTVEDCKRSGVVANGADISCDDLQVIGCGSSGVYASHGATITLSGQGTSIQGNGTKGNSCDYGLDARSSSSIQLVHPLTKEKISTNNGGGGNWGGQKGSTIDQVDNDGVVLQILYEGEDAKDDDY